MSLGRLQGPDCAFFGLFVSLEGRTAFTLPSAIITDRHRPTRTAIFALPRMVWFSKRNPSSMRALMRSKALRLLKMAQPRAAASAT